MTRLVPALECECCQESDFERLSRTARLDFELLPSGYAWVFPKKEHPSIGVLSARRRNARLQESLERYLALLGIHEPEKVERHGYVIPVKPRSGNLMRGRVLLAGDAAGLVDPVTGEGITYAIRSGQLAAQALLECEWDPLRTARRYQSLLEAEVLRELKSARVLAWILTTTASGGWLFRSTAFG